METLQAERKRPDTSPSVKKAILWLYKWCTTQPLPQKGLLLTGTQGTGKSFAMAALLRHLTLSYATHALFLDFQQFIRDLKHCYHRKDNDYELFDKLRQKDVLVLDDVQPTRDSPWIREVLHTIIAQRYNDCSRTFLTTNLSLYTELKDWATPHTYSRLKQMCYWLPFQGPDRRGIEE
jgi:DNA replication protein DnaC